MVDDFSWSSSYSNTDDEFVQFSIGRFKGHLLNLEGCAYVWLESDTSPLHAFSNTGTLPHMSMPLILSHPPKSESKKGGTTPSTKLTKILRAVHVRGMANAVSSFAHCDRLDDSTTVYRDSSNNAIEQRLSNTFESLYSLCTPSPAVSPSTALEYERFVAALSYRSEKVILLSFSGDNSDKHNLVNYFGARASSIPKDEYLGGAYGKWGPMHSPTPAEQAMLINQLCYILKRSTTQ